MVHFVGAGCGAPDLITVRGAKLLSEADVIIYAGSLVNPALLAYAKEDCEIHDSAKMTLEQVIEVMKSAEAQGKTTVRLHTGDSSIYGAVREQFDKLIELGIEYDVCPGVSSMSGAAAALKAEYTLPEVSRYPHGRPNARPGEREAASAGFPRRYHGAVPECRSAGRRSAGTDGGRLCA